MSANVAVEPYYDEGGITIYHGDCRDILPELGPVDVVVTDPPYGIGYTSLCPTQYRRRAGHKATIKARMAEAWDRTAPVDIVARLAADLPCLVWGGNFFSLDVSRGWFGWVKPDGPPSFSKLELAWTNADKPSAYISHSIAATNAERTGHPTQKPLQVMLASIGYLGVDGTVLDPFMGSGTTLVAAKQLGRKAIGIELEQKYCDIAIERLRQESLFSRMEQDRGQSDHTQRDMFGASKRRRRNIGYEQSMLSLPCRDRSHSFIG